MWAHTHTQTHNPIILATYLSKALFLKALDLNYTAAHFQAIDLSLWASATAHAEVQFHRSQRSRGNCFLNSRFLTKSYTFCMENSLPTIKDTP